MNKKQILEELERAIGKEMLNQEESIETTKKAAVEAPGRMESRYDSTKIEMSWLADGLQKRQNELYSLILEARKVCLENHSVVCEGCLVKCRRNQDIVHYFIIQGGAGRKISTLEGVVSCISPEAPVSRKIMGLAAGESVPWDKGCIEILAVC